MPGLMQVPVLREWEQYLDLASQGSLPSWSILIVSSVIPEGGGLRGRLTIMEDCLEPFRSSANVILLAIVHYAIPHDLLHIIEELLSRGILPT